MLLTHAKFKELKTLFSVSLSKFVRIATPKVARAKAKHTRTREMLTESNCSAQPIGVRSFNCQPYRTRESQHHVNSCGAARTRWHG